MASLGSSSHTGGILSSVKGTLGSIVSIDRVRKSSGGMEDAVNEEIDRAAERSARSDAVRLDLKTDLNGTAIADSFFSIESGAGLKTVKSSRSTSCLERGSAGFSPGGDDTGSKERLGCRNLPPLGVTGESTDGRVLAPGE